MNKIQNYSQKPFSVISRRIFDEFAAVSGTLDSACDLRTITSWRGTKKNYFGVISEERFVATSHT